MVRAFLALELSTEIRTRLEAPLAALRTSSARMTFVKPQNVHITLKFRGDVDDRTLPCVMDAVRTVSFTLFVVTVGSVTVNNPKRPFTIWCSIGDAGKANELFQKIEDALAPLGFVRETRKFTPHATLARIKDPDPSLCSVVKMLEAKTYGDCMVSGRKLKKSTLTPHGPEYEDLLEVTW